MQTRFHYSIKEQVSNAPEKEKISYPSVDFTVFHITRHIFFVHTALLMTYPMHWDIYENLLNNPDKQLAINLKSLRVLVYTCFVMKTKLAYHVCD